MKIKKIALVLVGLSAVGCLAAQQIASVSEVRKPGNKLTFKVALEGPSLSDVDSVLVQLRSTGSTPPNQNQKGLQRIFDVRESKQTSPSEFEVSGPIPEDVMSGEYNLALIAIRFKTPTRPGAEYYSPADFQSPQVIRIENPKHFENPKIKEVSESH